MIRRNTLNQKNKDDRDQTSDKRIATINELKKVVDKLKENFKMIYEYKNYFIDVNSYKLLLKEGSIFFDTVSFF